MKTVFHKTLEIKQLFGTEFEHCAIVSNFCYTPENKTFSVCFSNHLHHPNDETTLHIAGEKQTFWVNITDDSLFAELEMMLYREGILRVVETIFEQYQKQITHRFLYNCDMEE